MKHLMTFIIDFENESKSVDLEVYADYGNHGIGKYEFWGAYYIDDDWRWEIDDVKWDKSLYTDEENAIIEDFSLSEEKQIISTLEKINY